TSRIFSKELERSKNIQMVHLHHKVFHVPIEAYAFFGAVLLFLIIIILFFLYLNKKLCFVNCGGFPCITEPPKKGINKSDKLGSAYSYEDADTSSDSDDEVLQRYQAQNVNKKRGSKASKSQEDERDLISLAEKGLDAQEGKTPSEGKDGPHSNDGYAQSEQSTGPFDETSVEISEHDEHLFDTSDLLDEPPLISKCGLLEVTFLYDKARQKLGVTVIGARDIPAKDRGGANNTQVRLMLLPTKKQKHKTKIKQGEQPEYNEIFTFNKIPPDNIANMGIRFRLYGTERMRKENMIGESVVGFASLNLDEETSHWLTLEPRSNLVDSKLDVSSLSRSDSASSTQSMQHGGMPELLIGLAYNGTTGRLSAEIFKGSNFRNMAMQRAPDTYVKLTLMSPNSQEIARSKTSIRRGQPNPLYKETFMFQVPMFQLPDVTLMISVYNKRSMKRKEMIGWFSLGLTNSGEEEQAHWNDMRESKGEQVCRWHVLLES
ncbi:unnamed protein product, partial [Owenia fusiformis]